MAFIKRRAVSGNSNRSGNYSSSSSMVVVNSHTPFDKRNGSGSFDVPDDDGSSPREGGKMPRKGRTRGAISSSRSFWFRVFCLTGGVSLVFLTAVRRGVFVSNGRRHVFLGEEGEGEPDIQERRMLAMMKNNGFKSKPYTLADLLKLSSSFKVHNYIPDFADVTVILMDSPSLALQLKALRGSSVQAHQIWVVLPAKGATAGHLLVETYRRHGSFGRRLQIVKGDLFGNLPPEEGVGCGDGRFFNEKFGRFQLAMQATTNFVWVIDPGVIPGARFLELLAHVSSTTEITGALGGAGGLMPAAPTRAWRHTVPNDNKDGAPFALWDSEPPVSGRPRTGPAAVPTATGVGGMGIGGVSAETVATVLSPVDVLFSQWFLHKDLVRLLFREKWDSYGDSEGLTLAYSLRRYAGMNSYVLPQDSSLPEYCADVGISDEDAAAIAAASATSPRSHRRPFGVRSPTGSGIDPRSHGVGHHVRRIGGKGSGRALSAAAAAGGRNGAGDRNGNGNGGDREGDRDGAINDVGGRGGYSVTSAESLSKRLRKPALRTQFRELAARGGRFFWTPEQCPPELVVLVVDGKRQATLLKPLYRNLVDAAGANAGDSAGGAEVFIAIIMRDDGKGNRDPATAPPDAASRSARADCTEVAKALGVSPAWADGMTAADEDTNNGRPNTRGLDAFDGALRSAAVGKGGGVGAGGGEAETRWGRFGQAARDLFVAEGVVEPEGWRSHHFLTPEEFCLGDAFGVFHIRVGQDYRRAPGRPMDTYLDVYHGVSEVLDVVKPKIVAYVASPPSPEDTAPYRSGAEPGGRKARLEAATSSSTPYSRDNAIVGAVEAAVRSAGGGPKSSPRPIAVGVPDNVEGAAAAKALAYLPAGCLERWKKPSIVLVLVHQRGEAANLLSWTLRSLSAAHYMGDRVELRLTIHSGAVGDSVTDEVLRDFEWKWGPMDVTYFDDGSGYTGGGSLSSTTAPAGLAALEAFSAPKVHDHVIPLFSGAQPFPEFYVWFKFALMSEGYAPLPVPGHPLTHLDPHTLYGGGGARRAASAGGGKRDDGRGESLDPAVTTVWGSLLAFSVDIPQGLCPGGDGCSRVWMYGRDAWDALRERCRLAASGETAPRAARGQAPESLEQACGVGDIASRGGALWGLKAKHAIGAGPPSSIAGPWQRAIVWNVEELEP